MTSEGILEENISPSADAFLSNRDYEVFRKKVESLFWWLFPSRQSLEIVKEIDPFLAKQPALPAGTTHFLRTVWLACLDQVVIRVAGALDRGDQELNVRHLLNWVVENSLPEVRERARKWADEILASLPSSEELTRVKTARDKFVAHPDRKRATVLPTLDERLTIGELERLQSLAESSVVRLGFGARGDFLPPADVEGGTPAVLRILLERFAGTP